MGRGGGHSAVAELTPEERAEIDRQITLGQRARVILADEIVIECRKMVRVELLDAFERTAPSDSAARERIYMMLKMHDRVWEHLEKVLGDGKVADSMLPPDQRRGLLKF